jgi:hypothetical protein
MFGTDRYGDIVLLDVKSSVRRNDAIACLLPLVLHLTKN